LTPKSNQVERILSFLEDNEVAWYNTPIEQQLEKAGFAGDKYRRVPLGSENAAQKIKAALDDAKASNEKIVIHCSGGVGRTGLVGAFYLSTEYGLTAEEAVEKVTEQAAAMGVERKTKAEKVQKLLDDLK